MFVWPTTTTDRGPLTCSCASGDGDGAGRSDEANRKNNLSSVVWASSEAAEELGQI